MWGRREEEEMSNLEIKTPLLCQADQYTIGEYEELAIADFAMHVMNLYSNHYKDKNSELYSIGLYKVFEYEKSKKTLYINPKNINYTSTITDVRERLSQQFFPAKVDCCEVETRKGKTSERLFSVTQIPDWESLFGKGEFPIIVIRVFRIGNTEYFCYSISR